MMNLNNRQGNVLNFISSQTLDLKVNLSYKCDFNTYYVNKFISASRQQRPHVHAVIFNREGSCYGSFEAIKVMPELRFYSDPISMMHDNFTKDRLEVIGATLSMIVTVANRSEGVV